MPAHVLVFLALLIAAPAAYACAQPKSGPGYDSLIVVSGPHEDGHYKVSVPRRLAGHEHEAEVRVEYGKPESGDDDLSISPPQPSFSNGKEKIVLSLPADEIGNRQVLVRVFWPPNASGQCGAMASRSIGSKPDLQLVP